MAIATDQLTLLQFSFDRLPGTSRHESSDMISYSPPDMVELHDPPGKPETAISAWLTSQLPNPCTESLDPWGAGFENMCPTIPFILLDLGLMFLPILTVPGLEVSPVLPSPPLLVRWILVRH